MSKWSPSGEKESFFRVIFLVFCFPAEALTSTHHTQAGADSNSSYLITVPRVYTDTLVSGEEAVSSLNGRNQNIMGWIEIVLFCIVLPVIV